MTSYIRSIGTLFLLTVLPLLILLAACEKPPSEAELKESLWKRAELYWNKRLMDKDYESTYEMESEKDTIPFSVYKNLVFNKGQIEYLSVKTKEVKVEEDKGVVDLTMKCKIGSVPKPLDLTFKKDQWVFKSGKWMHVLDKE